MIVSEAASPDGAPPGPGAGAPGESLECGWGGVPCGRQRGPGTARVVCSSLAWPRRAGGQCSTWSSSYFSQKRLVNGKQVRYSIQGQWMG